MARLITSILSSIDGYCAGPGGELDKLPMGPAFDAFNLSLMREADAFIFGATTYSLFRSYWPLVDREGKPDPVERDIAERFNDGLKVVISDTMGISPDQPWAETEVVSRCHAERRLNELKGQLKGNLLIFGSSLLANDLFSRSLVDEINLLVANVVLGEGLATFKPGSTRSFRLIDQRRLPKSDIVLLRYRCRDTEDRTGNIAGSSIREPEFFVTGVR